MLRTSPVLRILTVHALPVLAMSMFVRPAVAADPGATEVASPDGARPPNVVLLMADDLGYGHLGCYGQEKIATPHVDRLAREGMRFTRAYAGAHVCQPSRCVLMTGRHTGHAAVRANDVDQMLLPEDVTVAEVFKEAGYATGVFGKWGLGFEGTTGHPNRQGFDESFGMLLQVHAHFYHPYFVWKNEDRFPLPGNEGGKREQYVEDVVHEQALDFVRRHADEPFFLYRPFIIPHVELVVPEESERPYRGKFPKQAILDPRPGYIGSQDGFTTVAGMISRMDGYVGEVLKVLEEEGIADDTLVIFTSDNGAQSGGTDAGWTAMTDFFDGNGGLRGYKGSYYEGGLRVPFVVRWPGHVQPGTTSDRVIGFQDLLPTCAEIVGVEPPADLDGVSLLPLLTGKDERPKRTGMYWEYPRGGKDYSRAALVDRWKAIQPGLNEPVQLYDLEADPAEQRDLATRQPEVVERLVKFMDAQHEAPRDYPPRKEQPTIRNYVR